MANQHIRVVLGIAEARQPVICVLVKRSFDLLDGQSLRRRDLAAPFLSTDEYHAPGDPETCAVKHEEELAPFKPLTDVVVIGEAHAPGGGAVETMIAGIEVGTHRKLVRVTGDRTVSHRGGKTPVFTDPKPFKTLPLRYDLAYGGRDERSCPDKPFAYPRNPVGRGVAIRNVRDAVDGLCLPNIEDPDDLLKPERVVIGDEELWNDQPLSQGLGWFQRTWYPRCSFVGAMPPHVTSATVMREEGLGLVAKGQIGLARRFRLPSFDPRFNNGASPGLALPALTPGTRVRLAGLSPQPLISFSLPDAWPIIGLDTGRGADALEGALHTVLVDVQARRVDMIWRGALPYPDSGFLAALTRLDAEAR